MAKVGRNDPCPCGSGKKYKNCCGLKTRRITTSRSRNLITGVILSIILIAASVAYLKMAPPETANALIGAPVAPSASQMNSFAPEGAAPAVKVESRPAKPKPDETEPAHKLPALKKLDAEGMSPELRHTLDSLRKAEAAKKTGKKLGETPKPPPDSGR